VSNDKVDATFHPDKRPLPSLDFVKPVGHDGPHHPVRNPAVAHMDAESDDAPAPPAHLDEH